MYIHRFSPEMFSVSRQRQQFMRRYDLYEDIRSVGDRLRWCRYSKGLGQKDHQSELLGTIFQGKDIEQQGTDVQIRSLLFSLAVWMTASIRASF